MTVDHCALILTGGAVDILRIVTGAGWLRTLPPQSLDSGEQMVKPKMQELRECVWACAAAAAAAVGAAAAVK